MCSGKAAINTLVADIRTLAEPGDPSTAPTVTDANEGLSVLDRRRPRLPNIDLGGADLKRHYTRRTHQSISHARSCESTLIAFSRWMLAVCSAKSFC